MSVTTTHASPFPDLTPETAPAASRRGMEAVVKQLGVLPAATARMALSPQVQDAFARLLGLFASTSLDAMAREVLVLTVATRNECELCVAMHSAEFTHLGGTPGVLAALRDQVTLPDARLDAVRTFTLRVMTTAGAVTDGDLDAFRGAGFTLQNALEIVLGIATYTLSTFANRLTRAPVDVPALAPFLWQAPATF